MTTEQQLVEAQEAYRRVCEERDNLRRALQEAGQEMDRRYLMGRDAERGRIVALSREVQATYWVGPDDSLAPRRPFFFLICESANDLASST